MASGRRDRPDRGAEPEPIGDIVRGALGAARMRRGLALGRVVRAWEELVGPRLAGESAPWALDERGLVVAASTAAWGAQVRFLADDVRRRVNEMLGSEQVRSVRVIVRSDAREALRRNDSGSSGRGPSEQGKGGSGW